MSKEIRYLATDSETGGVDPKKNPILTLYMGIFNAEFAKIDELELKIRPSEKYNIVEEDALKVNKIDLAAHIAAADTLDLPQAREKVLEFLKKHKGKTKWDKPIPLGHNVIFDINMYCEQLMTATEWADLVAYAIRDTKPVCDFLKDAGLLPPEIGNLGSLIKHFQIVQLEAHTAKDDTLMAIEAYRKLMEMVKGLANSGGSGGLTLDMLDILEK